MVRFNIYFIAVAVFVVVVFISQWVFIHSLRKDISDMYFRLAARSDDTEDNIERMYNTLASLTNKAIDQLDIDIEFTRSNETDDGK